MARGWESKSVEEQIAAKEAPSPETSRRRPSPEELHRRTKREGLHMARTRTLASLQSTCDSRYRAHLERVLADLDVQLLALEVPVKSQA